MLVVCSVECRTDVFFYFFIFSVPGNFREFPEISILGFGKFWEFPEILIFDFGKFWEFLEISILDFGKFWEFLEISTEQNTV